MEDDSSDMVYEVESEPDSGDAAVEGERVWAVEAKVDSGKVESDVGGNWVVSRVRVWSRE